MIWSVTFLIALAQDDVDRRLTSDKLRKRGNHDRITKLRTNPAGLLQCGFQLMFHAHQTELVAEVRNHPSRHLMQILRMIVLDRRPDREALQLCNGCEVL